MSFFLKRRPRAYRTQQQHLDFLDALAHCGIQKGIGKRELQQRMKDCIPEYYQQLRREREGGQLGPETGRPDVEPLRTVQTPERGPRPEPPD